MAEKRTEYGEVINKKVIGQLHNSPKHSFTVQDVAGGGGGDSSGLLKSIIERTATDIALPEDVASIGTAVFYMHDSLEGISMPNVENIGTDAFSGCTSLVNVSLPKIKNIGTYAFSGCTSLKTIDISSVNEIGDGAFNGCTSLDSVIINLKEPPIPAIGAGVFNDIVTMEHTYNIYVPASAVDAFESAAGWSNYASHIKPIEE